MRGFIHRQRVLAVYGELAPEDAEMGVKKRRAMKHAGTFSHIAKLARRITRPKRLEAYLRLLERLGPDIDDVEWTAETVSLEAEDLLLISMHVNTGVDRRVARPGKLGRKKTTLDIGEFARLGRLRSLTLNEQFDEWKRLHPDDERVKHPEHIREAYRRHFGDKARKGY